MSITLLDTTSPLELNKNVSMRLAVPNRVSAMLFLMVAQQSVEADVSENNEEDH